MMEKTKRTKGKFAGCKSLKDFYKAHERSKALATFAIYSAIIQRFNILACERLRDGETLDFGWGNTLRIAKRKNGFKRKFVDYKASDEHGMIIYHENAHTSRFYYRYLWRKGKIKNISAYCFLPSRDNKRQLAKAILVGEQDYLE